MRLTFLGGAGEVTGSAYLIESGRTRVLRDCGLCQGRREESQARNRTLWERSGGFDAVVVSHAHLDHCGNIPTVVKAGFGGPVYATEATADLMGLIWEDAAHVQEADVRFLRKRGVRVPETLEPLYGGGEVAAAARLVVRCPYGRPVRVGEGVEVVFVEAGHVLGSASTVFTVREGRRKLRVGFAVDLGRRGMPVVRDPEDLRGVDILVLESTYGGRDHEPLGEVEGRLAEVVNRTVERGGKVVIPSFALGRTQEVLYSLARLRRQGLLRVPDLPVFMDSPLAGRITEVFRRHRELFDREALAEAEAFLEPSDRLRFTVTKEESQAINDIEGPCVIVASSGMCEGGRILHHLMHTIEDGRNTVLFVGYQAAETLGRRILEGEERVRILDGVYRVRAEVRKLNAYSAHAGRRELVEFVRRCGRRLRHVVLVHGEPPQVEALAEALRGVTRAEIHRPGRGGTLEF